MCSMTMSMLTTTNSNNFQDTQYVSLLVGKKKHKAGKSQPLKGVIRVLKLFILCFVLPVLLLIYPLYLRNRVYTRQEYPIGVSDMITIDNKISTTWCQRQLISANTTFNAYVIANEPEISRRTEKIDMRRSILLNDGAKEYWGFYLLKESSFTISSCVRWPGASLIIIEGHKNLKECAFVGDNSSEENDDDVSSEENHNVTVINQMTKIVPGIVVNYEWGWDKFNEFNASDKRDGDFKLVKTDGKMKNIHLQYAEDQYLKERKKKTNMNIPAKTESKPFLSDSAEVLTDVLNHLKALGPKGRSILQKLQNRTANGADASGNILNVIDEMIKEISEKSNSSKASKKLKFNETRFDDEKLEFQKIRKEIMLHRSKVGLSEDRELNAGQEVFYEEDKEDVHVSVKNSKHGDRSKSEFWSSFSSSEERLIECKGLLVSLPLMPYEACDPSNYEKNLDGLAVMNGITYTVQSDGYYFFIFNNENEVEKNFIHAHFDIDKRMYNISEATATCRNKTSECSLPLSFWSRERTILELPNPNSDGLWNDEEFIFTTQCEPRSILYVICLMSVPIGILLFAFS